MPKIIRGRHTHRHEGPVVVFMIGMTINKPWKFNRWAPVFAAMPKMLEELSRDPDSGLLGYRMTIGRGGPLVIQYWSSTEALYRYAADPESSHRPAWAAFNRRARQDPGAVGIWHETYAVEKAESVYVDTPAAGLSRATSSVPVTTARTNAQDRLNFGA
ncbi:hypothetical protein H4W26_000476 [Nesterenkonia halotolerans]|uniref:DUF4188 domain-containing protein n=3 Tax=Nesterenkonia halotolerans TaxID=225325 RepID=A0ABR9J400_9MICC|nr:hypothetical protein [Nesterenkonia halotolerans]